MKLKTYTEAQFIEMLREECEKAGGAKPWGKAHGVSFSYVSAVLRKDAKPGKKILTAMKCVQSRLFIYRQRDEKKVMMYFEDVFGVKD